MNQKREKEFNELFKARDEINSKIHTNKNINDFQKYGLISTQWYQYYIYFIFNPKLESNYKYKEQLFKYELLHPKNDKRDYSYLEGIGIFNFPSNFIFVTENFMSLISDNFPDNEKNKVKSYLSTVLIGGECIIMRDFKKEVTRSMYIIIYEENKGNVSNNIDFILKYKDYNDLQNACKFILENNVWIFLKNIDFSEDKDEKEIKNEDDQIIGYIIRNGEIKRKDEIKLMQKMIGEDNKITKNIIPKFDSILNCLLLSNIFIQELSKFCTDNNNKITKTFIESFQNFKFDKIKSIFSISIKIDKFDYIFYEIFEKLDSELSKEKENKEFDGEEEKLKEFKELYEKGSIIKRLFYCPQEFNIFCTSCGKTFHKYQHSIIIVLKSIDIEKENLLQEKIFKAEEIQKKEKCRLCHEETDCLNSKKYISFPMILIIVIENDQIGKLNIEKEIKNDKGISYELYSIIEANTNMVYFKNNQNGLWFNYNDNKREEIESKIPIVLFFKLFANNNQINNNNQNYNNRNNNNYIPQINCNSDYNRNNPINNQNNINQNNQYNYNQNNNQKNDKSYYNSKNNINEFQNNLLGDQIPAPTINSRTSDYNQRFSGNSPIVQNQGGNNQKFCYFGNNQNNNNNSNNQNNYMANNLPNNQQNQVNPSNQNNNNIMNNQNNQKVLQNLDNNIKYNNNEISQNKDNNGPNNNSENNKNINRNEQNNNNNNKSNKEEFKDKRHKPDLRTSIKCSMEGNYSLIDKNESNSIKNIIEIAYSTFNEEVKQSLSSLICQLIQKKLGGKWFVFVSKYQNKKIAFNITSFSDDDLLIVNIDNSEFKIAKISD